jgi:hypothetical protein
MPLMAAIFPPDTVTFCACAAVLTNAASNNRELILIFKSKHLEPGGALTKRTPKLDAEVWIVAASAPTKALVKFRIEDAPGNGAIGDIATGARIGDAYAKAGKELGALILKETK